MQNFNWDDLRFVLAVHRTKTLSGAAKRLGVDHTTVSRRLKALERKLDVALFVRGSDAVLTLTDIGRTLAEHAERMEIEADTIAQALGQEKHRLSGTVRLTSVPIIVNRLLLPALPDLHAHHPDLTIELVPDNQNLSLTRREADLAIRLARPVTGGAKVNARRIGQLAFGLFVPAVTGSRASALDWITYDGTMAHLPQSRWLAKVWGKSQGTAGKVRVTDAETALESVAQGLGKTILPIQAGRHDPRLRLIDAVGLPALPTREVWLLSHPEQKRLAHIQAVVRWIEGIAWSR